MRVRVICFIALFMILPGCGERGVATYPVTLVVLDAGGRPARNVQVTFRSTERAVSARGRTDDEGKCRPGTFEAGDGLTAGIHQVAVAETPPETDPDEMPKSLGIVPPKYASFSSSGLEVDVSPDAENTFEVRLAP